MILLWILVLIIVYIKMIDPGKKRKHPVLNVKYYAHRGLHGEEGIPENSMAAFKKAKGSGYGIELDVQLTKDGVMVVHHDYDLKRTCGVNKKIADLTYRELCRYRLMGTRERIPRFVEVLREVDGKVPLLVELKMETCNRKLCKKVAKALDQYKGLYCMECFHPYALYWFKKNRPEVIRGQLSEQFLKEKEEGTLIRKIGYFIVKNLLTNFITKPDFIGAGTLFWIIVLSSTLLIINKKQKYIFVILPCLISWASIMVATPVAFSLRYVFMMVYSLPLIIMLPFMTKNKDNY